MPLPDWAARPEERRLLEGETLNRGVRRVVDAWATRDSETSTDFVAELKANHPGALDALDDQALGTICSLVWMYLGGGKSVNKASFMRWWDSAISSPVSRTPAD